MTCKIPCLAYFPKEEGFSITVKYTDKLDCFHWDNVYFNSVDLHIYAGTVNNLLFAWKKLGNKDRE